MTSEKRRKILFFTNSEYGQANVFLAVLYTLLQRPDLDLHFASFASLESKVSEVQHQANSSLVDEKHRTTLTFHALPFQSMTEIAESEFGSKPAAHPAGIRGAFKAYSLLRILAAPWPGQSYVVSTNHCINLIQDLDPDVVVIDPIFCQGIDACLQLGRKHVVLSPNTFKDLTRDAQSTYHNLCEIPTLASGFSYPVPTFMIPINIFLRVSLIFMLITSSRIRSVVKARKAAGFLYLHPAFKIYNPVTKYLSPSIPETDFPCLIPSNVVGCGPILLASKPVEIIDPDLNTWLQSSSSGIVLVNLGTLNVTDTSYALELGTALLHLLTICPEIRVLWKIKTTSDLSTQLSTLLSTPLSQNRIRITSWLFSDPLAILQTGKVIAAVHHGGSNTWHETLSVGIPQVVLPLWFDTYDFAARTEFLGIGIWGNRKVAPEVEGKELGDVLVRIVGEEGRMFREKAREIGSLVSGTGGREAAAEKILEWCAGPDEQK